VIESIDTEAGMNATAEVPRNRMARRVRPAPVAIPDPLFILSPPRSFTSVVCAMLGQHSEMYGLLETGLFNAFTMREWWNSRRRVGLLRCVAQLFFGEQTEASIRDAEAWLKRRLNFRTPYIFELLAAQVAPRMLVDKTPAMVYEIETMEWTNEMFPNARYLYMQRHPRGFGESVMKHVLRVAADKNSPPPRWLMHLAPEETYRPLRNWDLPLRDPQWDWHNLHTNILTFLESIPAERQMMMRGEDLLAYPDKNLRAITKWLGLRSDDAVIEEMKHPERGPYSFVGPPNARLGTSRYFLENPALRADRAKTPSLDGPLPWREDGSGFDRVVKRLALSFGYT
jgi:hypothetical protein